MFFRGENFTFPTYVITMEVIFGASWPKQISFWPSQKKGKVDLLALLKGSLSGSEPATNWQPRNFIKDPEHFWNNFYWDFLTSYTLKHISSACSLVKDLKNCEKKNIDLKCCTGGSLGPISRSQQKKVESKGENLRWNIFKFFSSRLISLLTPLCPDRKGKAELNEKKYILKLISFGAEFFIRMGIRYWVKAKTSHIFAI